MSNPMVTSNVAWNRAYYIDRIAKCEVAGCSMAPAAVLSIDRRPANVRLRFCGPHADEVARGRQRIGRPPRQLGLLDSEPYAGDNPPRVAGSDTSEAAAESVAKDTPRLRELVMAAIVARGDEGATDDEIEVATGLRHQTASARRRELVLLNRLDDTGRRRTTRSGRSAAVWRAR